MIIVIYGILIVLLVAFNIWQRVSIKLPAKRNVFAQIIWLILAVGMGLLTYLNAHNTEIIVGGIFIVTFFLTLLLWYPGLSNWGVLTSVRQIQSYQAFTKFETKPLQDNLTEVKFFSGDVLLSVLKIKRNQEQVDQFLNKVIKPREF